MPKTKVYEPQFKKKIVQLYLDPGRKDRKAEYTKQKEKVKDKILKIYHEHSGNKNLKLI